jgi:hypothetical protein
MLRFIIVLLGMMSCSMPAIPQDNQLLTSATSSSTSSGNQESSPVLAIESVELIRFPNSTDGGLIFVKGILAPSQTSPGTLVSISDGLPSDQILDLAFVAPISTKRGGDLARTDARFVFSGGLAAAKGVRVRSATNVIETNDKAGVSLKLIDFQKSLLGKAITSDDKGNVLVNGDKLDIPVPIRIVRSDTPLSESDLNPTRLTVFLGTDGKVVHSKWN